VPERFAHIGVQSLHANLMNMIEEAHSASCSSAWTDPGDFDRAAPFRSTAFTGIYHRSENAER
jgi:hypothetical protein